VKKAPDDNDLRQRGELPTDAFAGTAKVIPIRPDVLPFASAERLPGFPVEALPPAVRAFVTQLADSLEVPVDLPAVLALGALASASQGKYEAQARRDWREPLNLYLAVALDSGERKTPVFRRVLGPIREHEKALRKTWKEAKDAAAKLAEESGAKPGKPGKSAEGEAPFPRLLIDDTTPEAAARVMAEQGERITLASDEGTIFGHMTGMYSKTPNNGLWLKSHDGSTYVIDRRNGPPVFLESPLATLALAVQPSVIRGLAEKPELRGQGLWARFAYSFPRSRVGARSYETTPVDPQVEDAYRAMVIDIAERHFPPAGEEPIALRFSGAAWGRLRDALVKLDRQMGPGGPLASVRDWASKLSGLIVRLSGLLHVAEHDHPGQHEVSEKTLARAIAIGDYFLAHARQAFEIEMTSDPAEQRARLALELIERKTWADVTARQLRRFTRGLSKRDADDAIERLVDRGYLADAPGRRGGVYLVVKVAPEPEPAPPPEPTPGPLPRLGNVPANETSAAGAAAVRAAVKSEVPAGWSTPCGQQSPSPSS